MPVPQDPRTAGRPLRVDVDPLRQALDGHQVDGHRIDGHQVDGHLQDGHAGDGHRGGARVRASDTFESSELEVLHLRRLMATLPVIEQAKGVLMGYFGVTDDAAFGLLRRWSSVRNQKLWALSADLVTAAARPAGRPFAALAEYLRANQLS